MNILESIERNAELAPDRLAYVHATAAGTDERLTWAELSDDSDRLAACILDTVSETRPVIVYGHKDPLMIESFLACSKSGRAYCPVDTSVPPARVQSIIDAVQPHLVLAVDDLPCETSESTLVLTKTDIADRIRKTEPRDLRGHWFGPDDVYYIIFTSGSTGMPKGVQITRDCLDNFVAWGSGLCGHSASEGYVFLNQAPFSFDLSVMDLYLCLALGGTEFALDKELLGDMPRLFPALGESDASVWVSTPSFVDICLADRNFCQDLMPHMRTFLFCGETLTNRTVSRLHAAFPSAVVYNTYGPTESTVAVTGIQVSPEVNERHVPLPVGAPKAGTEILIVDAEGKVLPEGERGEILIVGDTVSVGYWNDAERTSKAFTTWEIDGVPQRAYHTGDKGYIEDGQLYYCGRIDLQIKLHGYRIEIEDIEANIMRLPDIERVAVMPVRRPSGEVRSLTAFVVLKDHVADGAAGARELRDELRAYLPDYMVPKRIKVVDDLPITANGKVDRRALGSL